MNVNPTPLRLGILGVGHFGRFHALKAAANPAIHLIGLHDASFDRAAQIAGEVGAPALAPEAVIAAADALHDHADLNDELWQRLHAHLSDEQALDLFMLAGWYHAISYAANGARVDMEPGAPSFADYL